MKYGFIFLKLLLFILVSYFLFREISFQQISEAMLHANWALLIIAPLFYFLKYAIQGVRWYNAAQAHNLPGNLLFFVRGQLEIAFLEMAFIFPDSEDALRILKLRSVSSDGAKNLAVALFDRVTGTIFVLMLLPLSGLWVADIVLKYTKINYPLEAALCIFLIVCGLSYRKIISLTLKFVPQLMKINQEFFENLKHSMTMHIDHRYRAYGFTAVIAYALSGICCAWLLVHSLGAQVSFISLFLCIPFFYISQTLPISYQGLGLYEATLVFILQQTGVNKEIALAAGTLHFLFHILVILAGGGLFLTNSSKMGLSEIGGANASGLKKINAYFFSQENEN